MQRLKTESYCAYVRKSRKDIEAELHGEGETLARHIRILSDLAGKMKITIGEVYREIVSGESIASRPEMLRLLDDLESGKWKGVLVVEVERLARGDTRDQGLLMETFKYNSVKIITPTKIYDPNDEFDAEYFEFGLFMSRREYNTIKRRLQAGKIEASKEGKFAGGRIPYGYAKKKLTDTKGFSLDIVPEQAEVVRLIFELYTQGTKESNYCAISTKSICNILNDMHIKPMNAQTWTPGVIRDIISNCVYVGKIRWGHRKTVKVIKNGIVTKSHPIQKDFIIADGLHQAIISEDTYNLAQELFLRRSKRPAFMDSGLKNPFATVLKCGLCGRTLVRRPASKKDYNDWFICSTRGCTTAGSKFPLVESKIIDSLSNWLEQYKVASKADNASFIGTEVLLTSYKNHENELVSLEKQLDKVYNFFETGIYTLETFNERSQSLKHKIVDSKEQIINIKDIIKQHKDYESRKVDIIPKFEHLLTHYGELSIEEKNYLIKEVVEKIEYFKESKGTKKNIPEIILKIYPRV